MPVYVKCMGGAQRETGHNYGLASDDMYIGLTHAAIT